MSLTDLSSESQCLSSQETTLGQGSSRVMQLFGLLAIHGFKVDSRVFGDIHYNNELIMACCLLFSPEVREPGPAG